MSNNSKNYTIITTDRKKQTRFESTISKVMLLIEDLIKIPIFRCHLYVLNDAQNVYVMVLVVGRVKGDVVKCFQNENVSGTGFIIGLKF